MAFKLNMQKVPMIVSLVALLVFVASASLGRIRLSADSEGDELFFPTLLDRLDDVVQIVGQSDRGTFTLQRLDQRWIVREKYDYVADANLIRKLLYGAASLRRIPLPSREQGTSVEPPDDHGDGLGGQSLRLTFRTARNDVVADFILTDSRAARSETEPGGIYVSLPNSDEAWFTQGWVPHGHAARDWLDRNVFDIDRRRVREVRVRQPGEEGVTVSRQAPSDTDYYLIEPPENSAPSSQRDVKDFAWALYSFQMKDIRPARELHEDHSRPEFRVDLETFDGLHLTMRTVQEENETYAQLFASVDDAPAVMTREGQNATGVAGNIAGDLAGAKTKGADDPPERVAAESEADMLNARWSGWAYALPDYLVDYLSRARVEFLAPPDPGPVSRGG